MRQVRCPAWAAMACVVAAGSSQLPAQQPAPGALKLTLEEVRQRAVNSSKGLALAGMNIQSKDFATRAVRADYFPKLIGSVLYFHFDSPLGSILTTRGRPLLGVPAQQVAVNVVNQDQTLSTIGAAQPITALLKIRQGVTIARADEQIAQAQLEKGTRALLSGVEQLYWGLLASQRIRAGAQLALQGAEALAKTGALEARTALIEARQNLQGAENQVAEVQEQLNNLLDLPLCTVLEPVDPPLPTLTLNCADEAIGIALAVSPELREAEQDVVKARAAIAAAKVDYLPNVNVIGGYAHQEGIPSIQPDIGYLGLQGSYTFFEWGKRKNTVRERETVLAMAQQKLTMTQDEVRLKVRKAFREVQQCAAALSDARAMVELRKEATKRSGGDMKTAIAAAKDEGDAELSLVKAELAYRTAYGQLMSVMGRE